MSRSFCIKSTALLCVVFAGSALADSCTDTIALFRNSKQSSGFFSRSYAYAVFPTIGKGGFVVGGAHGKGRVYVQGEYAGNTAVTQLSVGWQLGGQAYSEIVFLQDKRAFEEFTKGDFEFGAGVGAVAITAAASASAGTSGANAGASGGKHDAVTAGEFFKGMAVFTIVKGGAMYEASIAGQKFTYSARGSKS